MNHRFLAALFAGIQYLLPQHGLSRIVHALVRIPHPWLKNTLIRMFCAIYRVDLSEAVHSSPDNFESFNDFFTRPLRPDARPICSEPGCIASPADGVVSQIGFLRGSTLLQAKGKHFDLVALLGGGGEFAQRFENGSFVTLYLSPRDYHRIHLPLDAILTAMTHVPGALFSVNAATVETVPNLFARNERVICHFESEAGPMAVILVGALFVSSIETVWHGVVTPPGAAKVRHWDYTTQAIRLQRGDEIGRFNMGSTVIVLFGKDRVRWDSRHVPGSRVRMGESLGSRC
ncbi:MAG TPA: archaetidylserine decarboxylase [Methylococcus sp.]|nr:archaetidylserine decarboxylase [Methylococcus sp.]